jgi:hypothetical protein
MKLFFNLKSFKKKTIKNSTNSFKLYKICQKSYNVKYVDFKFLMI